MSYLRERIVNYWNFVTDVPKGKKGFNAWKGMILYDICVLNLFSLILVLKIVWR